MASQHTHRSEWKRLKEVAPDVDDILRTLGNAAAKAGLDKSTLELIKIRASQINGCAFCLQFHILAAERLGIPADKINLVTVWREVALFSVRERAALAWTEALTLIPQGISDELYADVSREFDETELTYLTSAIAGINAWNRFGAAFRWSPPERVVKAAAAE